MKNSSVERRMRECYQRTAHGQCSRAVFFRMQPRARWSFLHSGLGSDLWVPEEEFPHEGGRQARKMTRCSEMWISILQTWHFRWDRWCLTKVGGGDSLCHGVTDGTRSQLGNFPGEDGAARREVRDKRKSEDEAVSRTGWSIFFMLTKKKEYTEEVCGMWRNLMQTETNSQRKVFCKPVEEDVMEKYWVDEGRREV